MTTSLRSLTAHKPHTHHTQQINVACMQGQTSARRRADPAGGTPGRRHGQQGLAPRFAARRVLSVLRYQQGEGCRGCTGVLQGSGPGSRAPADGMPTVIHAVPWPAVPLVFVNGHPDAAASARRLPPSVLCENITRREPGCLGRRQVVRGRQAGRPERQKALARGGWGQLQAGSGCALRPACTLTPHPSAHRQAAAATLPGMLAFVTASRACAPL